MYMIQYATILIYIILAGKPEYVRLLGTNSFEKRDKNSKLGPRADPVGPETKYRSNFAYSAPFQVWCISYIALYCNHD